MIEYRVQEAADAVQIMPPIRRALLAREALILSINGRVEYGPKEGVLRAILSVTGLPGLVICSFLLLIGRVFTARKGAKSYPNSDVIFIGIGALREPRLISEISKQTEKLPLYIDQRDPAEFRKLSAPGFRDVLARWFQFTSEAISILKSPCRGSSRLDLFATLTMRCHELAFLTALFDALYSARPNLRIAFSTTDIASHAATIAGFSTEYHQHGLLARSLVFANFSTMFAITKFEGQHVADRIPGLVWNLQPTFFSETKNRTVLAIAGDYIANDPGSVIALVDFAQALGLSIVVRPHPRGDDRLWCAIRERDQVTFENDGSFEDFLGNWRPMFVASWFSTTLVDALMAGSLPITLSEGRTELVLPLREIALHFPKDNTHLKACVLDIETREQTQSQLYSVIM